MNAPNVISALPAMVRRAADALASATHAAEVLEARDMAGLAYDTAKRAARIRKAKDAHDSVIAAAHRAQADALDIEAAAKRRLADEYDAAQARGEVASGRPKTLPDGKTSATASEIGLTSKDVHEARKLRDAEKAEPGIARRALDAMLAARDEPTRAALRREIMAKAKEFRGEIQRERHSERLARMETTASKGSAAAPGRLGRAYGIYYADPPWRFSVHDEATGREKSAENHYPTSATDDIASLMAGLCGGDNPAVLFLWATNPMLPDGLRVMEACGFTYVHHWIWDKEVAGTGYWGRDRHELLLIGRRGAVAAPLPGSQPQTVHREKKGRHSAKPDFFAETIERLFPGVSRIELFRRGPARPGWDAWGYEAQGPDSERVSAKLKAGTETGAADDEGPGGAGAEEEAFDPETGELLSGGATGAELPQPWFRPAEGADSASSPVAVLQLRWHQANPPCGRILAMAGPLEVAAMFPPAEAGGHWTYSYWLGKVTGPHKYARTEASARKAIEAEWAAFCATSDKSSRETGAGA